MLNRGPALCTACTYSLPSYLPSEQVTVNDCTPRNPPALTLAQHVSLFCLSYCTMYNCTFILNCTSMSIKLHQIAPNCTPRNLPAGTLAQHVSLSLRYNLSFLELHSAFSWVEVVFYPLNIAPDIWPDICTKYLTSLKAAQLHMYLWLHKYIWAPNCTLGSCLYYWSTVLCELYTPGRVSHCER